jgi:beta-N-acetylhexosaminidase
VNKGRQRKGEDPPFLMVGFEGKTVPSRLAAWLREGTVGGVVLFFRNVEGPRQVRDLCRQIRAAAGRSRPAPLIAIDQEGGRVRRLKDPGFTQFPPARCFSLFCCHAERAAEAAGAFSAEELSAVGIDINFAPVLDVDDDPKNPPIGDRSFSGDPETAARLGIAFMRGCMSRNIVPVGKHFPGHGHADADSHETLPMVQSPRKTLLRRDIVPFLRAARAGIPAMMTAHVLYPALDREHPATLSHKIITGLLRDKVGFRGAVFSDSLEMKAVSDNYGIGKAAVLAMRAGCDVAMVCRGEDSQAETVESLAREWRDDGSFRRMVAAANRRVARLRALNRAPGERRASLRSVGSKVHREAAALLSERWESSVRTSEACISDSIGER